MARRYKKVIPKGKGERLAKNKRKKHKPDKKYKGETSQEEERRIAKMKEEKKRLERQIATLYRGRRDKDAYERWKASGGKDGYNSPTRAPS